MDIELLDIKEDTMNLLEQFIEEGREEGMVKGRLHEGRSILHKLLQRRFGALTADQKQAIDSADLDAIERWSTGIFEVDSVDDLLRM